MGDSSPLTPTVFHILLALEGGPLHGYAIMKQVEAEAGLQMGPGTIYGSIQRLRQAGWLAEAGAVEGQSAQSTERRRGKAFELTPEGRAALTDEARRIRRLAAHATVERLVSDGA